MSLVEFLILSLGTWRLSALLSYERGPADIFVKFRRLLSIEHGEDGEPSVWPDRYLPNLITCVWCLSTMVGLGVWIGDVLSKGRIRKLMAPLAFSAISILIQRILGR